MLILGVSTMTVSWLAIWIALLGATTGLHVLLPAPLQELVVVSGGIGAWRLLVTTRGQREVRAFFVLAALAMALLAVWMVDYQPWFPLDPRWLAWAAHHVAAGRAPATPVTACITLLLWGVGGRIGARDLDGYRVLRFFETGLAGLFAGLVTSALAGAAAPPVGMLGAATALFFGSALLILPLAQIIGIQNRGHGAGAHPARLDSRWLATAGAAALIVLSLAVLLSRSASDALLGLAGSIMARVADLLDVLVTPVLLGAGYLVAALVWLATTLRGAQGYRQPVTPQIPPLSQFTRGHQTTTAHVPSIVTGALQWAVIAIIAVAVLVIVSSALGRLSGLRHDQVFEEERDSVWSSEEASAAWRALLATLAHLGRSAHLLAPDRHPPRTIREVYRHLLRRGAQLGHARAAPETPQEYLARLRRLPIPDERDAALLTSAYMRTRYGNEPLASEEVTQIINSWERLDRGLLATLHGQGASDEHVQSPDGQGQGG